MTSIERYELNKRYNRPSSQAERAKGGAKLGPVATVRARHRDEKSAMGARHRASSLALEAQLTKARARDSRTMREVASDADIAKKNTPTHKLAAKHANERNELAARHSRELEAAAARNQIP
jgi:hypothetical protein